MTRDPFSGLRPSNPVPELRARVLREAHRAAARRDAPRPAARPFDVLVDRLWASRRLRLAWAVAVVVLTVLNLALGEGPGAGRGGWPQGVSAERSTAGAIASAGLLRPRPEHTLASYYEPAAIEALGL